MTDRLRSEAEKVAHLAQPPEVRGPWLDWNGALIDMLNQLAMSQEEIKHLLTQQVYANTAAIASGLREYAAGDEMRRAAHEAEMHAEVAALRAQLLEVASQRAEDTDRLRAELDRRHAELLNALARVSGRQARRAPIVLPPVEDTP